MGIERSASQIKRKSPLASNIPRRTASPLPRFGSLNKRTAGANSSATAAVPILASILNHQYFRFIRLFAEEGLNLGEGTWKALFFVVRRDDQRQEGQGQLENDVSQHDEGDAEHQNQLEDTQYGKKNPLPACEAA